MGLLDIPNYNPNRLFDEMRDRLNMRYDAQLARLLGVTKPSVNKMRSGKIPVGTMTLIRLHESTEISVKELRATMGDNRPHFSERHVKSKLEKTALVQLQLP